MSTGNWLICVDQQWHMGDLSDQTGENLATVNEQFIEIFMIGFVYFALEVKCKQSMVVPSMVPLLDCLFSTSTAWFSTLRFSNQTMSWMNPSCTSHGNPFQLMCQLTPCSWTHYDSFFFDSTAFEKNHACVTSSWCWTASTAQRLCISLDRDRFRGMSLGHDPKRLARSNGGAK